MLVLTIHPYRRDHRHLIYLRFPDHQGTVRLNVRGALDPSTYREQRPSVHLAPVVVERAAPGQRPPLVLQVLAPATVEVSSRAEDRRLCRSAFPQGAPGAPEGIPLIQYTLAPLFVGEQTRGANASPTFPGDALPDEPGSDPGSGRRSEYMVPLTLDTPGVSCPVQLVLTAFSPTAQQMRVLITAPRDVDAVRGEVLYRNGITPAAFAAFAPGTVRGALRGAFPMQPPISPSISPLSVRVGDTVAEQASERVEVRA